MSFKKFFSTHSAQVKDGVGNKAKGAPGAYKPATQPDKAPTEVAPTPKS